MHFTHAFYDSTNANRACNCYKSLVIATMLVIATSRAHDCNKLQLYIFYWIQLCS
jgi:hypothetical protein